MSRRLFVLLLILLPITQSNGFIEDSWLFDEKFPMESPHQLTMIKNIRGLLDAVQESKNLTMAECGIMNRHQSPNSILNCPTNFKSMISFPNQAAYFHALSSASLLYNIMKKCSTGEFHLCRKYCSNNNNFSRFRSRIKENRCTLSKLFTFSSIITKKFLHDNNIFNRTTEQRRKLKPVKRAVRNHNINVGIQIAKLSLGVKDVKPNTEIFRQTGKKRNRRNHIYLNKMVKIGNRIRPFFYVVQSLNDRTINAISIEPKQILSMIRNEIQSQQQNRLRRNHNGKRHNSRSLPINTLSYDPQRFYGRVTNALEKLAGPMDIIYNKRSTINTNRQRRRQRRKFRRQRFIQQRNQRKRNIEEKPIIENRFVNCSKNVNGQKRIDKSEEFILEKINKIKIKCNCRFVYCCRTICKDDCIKIIKTFKCQTT
ncbi:hypothetical protein SNEBB_001817 [Seison nebaliae]|nr:hypothetical protein SNEBB_001817 [Seison nebaliae]